MLLKILFLNHENPIVNAIKQSAECFKDDVSNLVVPMKVPFQILKNSGHLKLSNPNRGMNGMRFYFEKGCLFHVGVVRDSFENCDVFKQ